MMRWGDSTRYFLCYTRRPDVRPPNGQPRKIVSFMSCALHLLTDAAAPAVVNRLHSAELLLGRALEE
jgi:hypothetical protein